MVQSLKISLANAYSRTNLAIWALLALVIATAGPFGTYESQSFGVRLIYWSLVVLVSSTLGALCNGAARALAGVHRPILSDLLMVVLMTLVFTPMLIFLTRSMFILPPGGKSLLPRIAIYVALITAGICVSRRLLPGFEPVSYFGPKSEPPPRIVRRLPEDFEGPILHLTVRDHFVDVVTPKDTHTIRLRFADAIDEMDTVRGFTTHRSHWVARDAVKQAERENGRVFLNLVNGDRVPVSRTYQPDLHDAGLI